MLNPPYQFPVFQNRPPFRMSEQFLTNNITGWGEKRSYFLAFLQPAFSCAGTGTVFFWRAMAQTRGAFKAARTGVFQGAAAEIRLSLNTKIALSGIAASNRFLDRKRIVG